MRTGLVVPLLTLASCDRGPLPSNHGMPTPTQEEVAARQACANLSQQPVMEMREGQTGFSGPLERSDYSKCMRDESNKHSPANAQVCERAGGVIRNGRCELDMLIQNN